MLIKILETQRICCTSRISDDSLFGSLTQKSAELLGQNDLPNTVLFLNIPIGQPNHFQELYTRFTSGQSETKPSGLNDEAKSEPHEELTSDYASAEEEVQDSQLAALPSWEMLSVVQAGIHSRSDGQGRLDRAGRGWRGLGRGEQQRRRWCRSPTGGGDEIGMCGGAARGA